MQRTTMAYSFSALEFERLRSLLSRYVSSVDARSAIAEIQPFTEIPELESEHELTAEAMEKLAVAGTALEIPEIEAVQSFLIHIEGLRTRWKDDAAAYPRLFQRSAGFPDMRELSRQLGRG